MANKVVSIEDRVPKLKEERKKRANRRLLILILLLFFIFACIAYFQSPYSKVGDVVIKGNMYTQSNQILQQSGLTEKPPLLLLKEERVKKNITTLPQLKSASMKVSFPNKVEIVVEEYERLAYLFEENGMKVLLENGESISLDGMVTQFSGPIVKGFDQKEHMKLLARQLAEMPTEVKNAISEIIYSPKKTDKYRIIAYMNDGFEVHASLRTFGSKMAYYPSIVKQLDPDVKGIIDMEVGLFFRSYQSMEEDGLESGEESES